MVVFHVQSTHFHIYIGVTQCKLCPVGTVATNHGSTKCTPCKAAQFRSRIINKMCASCRKGTTSKGSAPAGCKHPKKGCPIGTFEDWFGECRSCMPGERFDGQTKTCKRCGINQISSGCASQGCKSCSDGNRRVSDDSIFEIFL